MASAFSRIEDRRRKIPVAAFAGMEWFGVSSPMGEVARAVLFVIIHCSESPRLLVDLFLFVLAMHRGVRCAA